MKKPATECAYCTSITVRRFLFETVDHGVRLGFLCRAHIEIWNTTLSLDQISGAHDVSLMSEDEIDVLKVLLL